MIQKKVIILSCILFFAIVPLAGCTVQYSFRSVDTKDTLDHDFNGTDDKIQSLVNNSGSSSTAIVYVDTDGTGNYNCDGINDHVEINKALAYIDSIGGGTVYLKGPHTYWIDDTMRIWSNTVLTGDPTAEIKLVANAGWSTQIPIFTARGGSYNIKITGFTIDGNSGNQTEGLGEGYYNMIYFWNVKDVEVSHMHLEWGHGDGLRTEECSDIKFLYNDVYKLGHDGVYYIFTNNTETAYNSIVARTDSAARSQGGSHQTIHDNIFYSFIDWDSTGPLIKLDKSEPGVQGFDDIEIYDNQLYTSNGAGIQLDATYEDDVIRSQNVYIHHNTFTNVGQYSIDTGYSNSAIVIGNFNNTIIENNVIDDPGQDGIRWYVQSGPTQKTHFYTYVRNNVIMGSRTDAAVPHSGAGIWNTNTTYAHFIVENNDIYDNDNGQIYPTTGPWLTMSDNLNVDPMFCNAGPDIPPGSRDYHLKSKEGRWAGAAWVYDPVSSPLIDAGSMTSPYDKEPADNGNRINIGRYGNTEEASKSVSSAPVQDSEPISKAGPDLNNIFVSSMVTFDGSASSDDNSIVSYSWDFDAADGISTEATGVTATKTYTAPGNYTVTLTVTDTVGQTDSDMLQVIVTTPAATIAHTPGYDNRLRQSSPNSVLSSSNYIDVGRLGTTSYRDVMWFNLSAYNAKDTISQATLSLYWYYPSTTRTSDTVVEVYRPEQWDPSYVTWNSRMSGTPWDTAGGYWYDKNGVPQGTTPYASVTFPAGTIPDNKYYEFDVTQLVQEYVSGTANTGFFLKAKTEGNNYIAFYSSDWPSADQRPKLTITTTSGTTLTDNPPVAEAGPDQVATTDTVVTFNGSASTDDKDIVSYSWDFDAADGITTDATGVTATTTYATPGNYTVTLTVTDTVGQTDSDTLQVVVNSPTTTVTLIPDYDNRLRQSSPNTVYSSTNYLDIGRLGTTSYRDVMWFDLSGYTQSDTISKATLSLYWYYPSTARTSDTVVEIYRPEQWDPSYVTWNNRASGTTWSTAGGYWYDKNGVAQGTTPYASVTFPAGTVADNNYYEFDVTQLVQEYVSGTANTGFFLKAKTENGNYIAFYSSEWSDASQRPKLTVTMTSSSLKY